MTTLKTITSWHGFRGWRIVRMKFRRIHGTIVYLPTWMVDVYGCLISNHVLNQRYLTLSYTLCGGGNRLCIYYDLNYPPPHTHTKHPKHGQNRHIKKRVKLETDKKSCLASTCTIIPVDFPKAVPPCKHFARILADGFQPGMSKVFLTFSSP